MLLGMLKNKDSSLIHEVFGSDDAPNVEHRHPVPLRDIKKMQQGKVTVVTDRW